MPLHHTRTLPVHGEGHTALAPKTANDRHWAPMCSGGSAPPPPPEGCIRTAVPFPRLLDPPPPPPLPMFEADSQNFASAPSVPRGFTLQNSWLAFGGDHRGTLGGSQTNTPSDPPPPPPSPPSNTSLCEPSCAARVQCAPPPSPGLPPAHILCSGRGEDIPTQIAS